MVEATVGKRKRQIGLEGKGKKGKKKISRETKKKEAQRRAEQDAEEARFRDLVFGKGEAELLKALGTEVPGTESSWPEDEAEADVATVKARKGQGGGRAKKGTKDAATGKGGDRDGGEDGPAWVDEDDADLRVDISAKNRLRKLRISKRERKMTGAEFEKRLRGRFAGSSLSTGWAKSAEEDALKAARGEKLSRKTDSGYYSSGDEEEVMDVEELLRDSSPLAGDQGRVLQAGSLDIVRLRDANQQEPAKSVVRAVSFHPTGELLLAGGFDKTLRLFQVDGVRNNKVHSIFFEDLPISNAVFTANDQAIVTGSRPYFYWYDVPTGKVQKVPRIFSSGRAEKLLETFAASPDGEWLAFVGSKGYVLLLSNHTKQWVTDFKLNCAAKTITFTADSQFLLASGADGDVYKFDVRSRRCVLRFFNEGGTCTTSLAVSGSTSHRFSAVGSASGVVNVYEDSVLEMGRGVLRPSPLKAVMNLTTPVTAAKFSPDGQILAIASNEKRDAFKMVHAPSCSVFTNWPTERTPVRRPYSLDFSPGGGFLAIGNDRGCVLLYRLRHYPQA